MTSTLIIIFRPFRIMPSKLQKAPEAEIDSDEEEMNMEQYPMAMPERKEYLWSCNLKGTEILDHFLANPLKSTYWENTNRGQAHQFNL